MTEDRNTNWYTPKSICPTYKLAYAEEESYGKSYKLPRQASSQFHFLQRNVLLLFALSNMKPCDNYAQIRSFRAFPIPVRVFSDAYSQERLSRSTTMTGRSVDATIAIEREITRFLLRASPNLLVADAVGRKLLLFIVSYITASSGRFHCWTRRDGKSEVTY